jgi:hypothetical protein
MLADAATLAEGKLYIQGGGWTSIIAPQMPAVHPALAIVLVFRLDWHEGNEDLVFDIELVDEDGKPAGMRGEMHLRVAPTPGATKGTYLYSSIAQSFYGLRFNSYGTYQFKLTHKDQLLASVPLTIAPRPF